jgi:hypothetical protein
MSLELEAPARRVQFSGLELEKSSKERCNNQKRDVK